MFLLAQDDTQVNQLWLDSVHILTPVLENDYVVLNNHIINFEYEQALNMIEVILSVYKH